MSDYPHLLRLIETMATLRGEGGCAWDREQDHQSLVPYLIEEVHELVDAIESGDVDEMREELGDVLYQLLFHADIAREDPTESFSIDDVARATDEKMRRRHPHVFGDVTVENVEQIRDNWAAIKAAEKSERTSVLDGVPSSLTGLARAEAVLAKATKLDRAPAVGEPVAQPGDQEQWGQWLLAAIAQARAAGINADQALRAALRNYETRVRRAEQPPADSTQ